MGLVTCEKCKKLYDYDKYNGICPKCARYNRESSSSSEHQEYHNRYDGGYSHTAQDNHHSYHQKYDDNRNPHGSQLEGVQETLREVMGTEHKVNLDGKNTKEANANKTKKILIGVVLFFIFFNLLIPFFGVLLIPVIIGMVLYFVKKNTK